MGSTKINLSPQASEGPLIADTNAAGAGLCFFRVDTSKLRRDWSADRQTACIIRPLSDFGFRAVSFGFRVSVFGFQGCMLWPGCNRLASRAALTRLARPHFGLVPLGLSALCCGPHDGAGNNGRPRRGGPATVRHHALERRTGRRPGRHSAVSRRPGTTLSHLLVSPLRLYSAPWIRSRGRPGSDPGILLRPLDRRWLPQVDRQKGRFRSFLLVAMNHFLANEWDRATAVKRGGRVLFQSLEDGTGEQRFADESQLACSPEELYDQRWATTLLQTVLSRLRQEAAVAGWQKQFEHLEVFLTGEKRAGTYAELAAGLGTTEGALKMATQRLRRRTPSCCGRKSPTPSLARMR